MILCSWYQPKQLCQVNVNILSCVLLRSKSKTYTSSGANFALTLYISSLTDDVQKLDKHYIYQAGEINTLSSTKVLKVMVHVLRFIAIQYNQIQCSALQCKQHNNIHYDQVNCGSAVLMKCSWQDATLVWGHPQLNRIQCTRPASIFEKTTGRDSCLNILSLSAQPAASSSDAALDSLVDFCCRWPVLRPQCMAIVNEIYKWLRSFWIVDASQLSPHWLISGD